MVNHVLLAIVLMISGATAHAVDTKPLRSIQVKAVFTSKVESPNHLIICGGRLWTYSVSQQSLYSIDVNSGETRRAFVFNTGNKPKVGVDLSALACQQDRLLTLINSEGKKPIAEIFEFNVGSGSILVGGPKKYVFPGTGRATDIFCNLERCWVLREQLFVSEDFRRWRNVAVPAAAQVRRAHRNPELNPFEDWQASLILAHGKYTKGAINSENQLALLDPFHAQVVIRAGYEWEKWGAFGAWEGSFLSPKSLIFLADNILAIADAKLKAIFLFRKDGVYLGIVSTADGQIFSPDYPLGMAALGDRLFVADFRLGQVKALDLSDFRSTVEIASELNVRQNLFRRPVVLKDQASTLCLNCHDGTQSNQLFKFVKSQYHHPLECSKCHDPHHEIAQRSYLRQAPGPLCLSCHKDYAKTETNHIWKDAHKKGGACVDCHHAHTEAPQLLNQPAPQICMDCHKGQSLHHRPVENVLGLDRAKGLHFLDGKISCTTCHQTHINWRKGGFLRERDQVRVFCASCHGAKTDHLYQDFHKIMKTKGIRP